MGTDLAENGREEFKRAWSLLYHRIGLCVTVYQQIEDGLEGFFILLSKDTEAAAKRVFAEMRGLDSKLNVISAVSLNYDDDIQTLWEGVRKEIRRCADNRNQIAHSTGVSGGVTFSVDEMGGVSMARNEPIAQARKATKSGESKWDAERLLAEFRQLETLTNKLAILRYYLTTGAIPAHLQPTWDNPIVRSWPTR